MLFLSQFRFSFMRHRIYLPTTNIDSGDTWPQAGRTDYRKKFSALGFQIGVRHVLHEMTP